MGEEKLLSVIIPVYNTAPYLERCVSSIRKQSYQTLEIICVDNNSTDDSLALLQQFASEDSRIVVLEQKKQGVSAARNMGIQNAHGEYITFVDSDDAIDPEMYSTLVQILEKEQVDIAHCGYRRYQLDGSYRDISGTGECIKEDKWQAINHLLRGEKYIGSLCNKVYRKELFSTLEMDETVAFNEDFLLNYQLFAAAETMVFLDEPLYLYYIRSESATSSSNDTVKSKNALAVSEKVWTMFMDTLAKDAAANKYYYNLECSYRANLFERRPLKDDEMRQIREKIRALENTGLAISQKSKIDYRLMKYLPDIYRGLYRLYDKIRKPNWDVNAE